MLRFQKTIKLKHEVRLKINQSGFTVSELLVSISLFSLIGLLVTGFLTQTFGRLGIENRISNQSIELSNAIQLISREIRTGSNVSPYLPGNNPNAVRCGAQITTTSNSLKFLVVHDDPSSASGIKAYYVGYIYDAAAKELRRGEVPSPSTTVCSVPIGQDPTDSTYSQVIAKDIISIDSDNNGIDDPVFSFTSPVLSINLGTSTSGNNQRTLIKQKERTNIKVRVL